jgi:hypothetical protein
MNTGAFGNRPARSRSTMFRNTVPQPFHRAKKGRLDRQRLHPDYVPTLSEPRTSPKHTLFQGGVSSFTHKEALVWYCPTT